jgi:VanZ family protein
MKAALAWGALLAYCGAIFAASASPHPPGAEHIGAHDKLVHAAAYAGMATLALAAAGTTFGRWSPRAWALFGWLFATAYGAADEIHQRFTPGRSPEVLDALADTGGAALAAGLFYAWFRWRARSALPAQHPAARR